MPRKRYGRLSIDRSSDPHRDSTHGERICLVIMCSFALAMT